jgi:hypothetical protein
MQNLQFTLCVSDSNHPDQLFSLHARVFDKKTLKAVLRGIDHGVYGHYSRRRYFLMPLGEIQSVTANLLLNGEGPTVLRTSVATPLFPNGGRQMNPVIARFFFPIAQALVK